MKKIYLINIFLFFTATYSYSQTIVDKFFSIDWDATQNSVKALFENESFTEKNLPELKEISFIDKIDSISFKVGFFFESEVNLKAKSISNTGKTPASGKNFYNLFKPFCVKKFGDSFEKKLVYKAEVISWSVGADVMVILSQKDEKAALTITKKRNPQNSKSN